MATDTYGDSRGFKTYSGPDARTKEEFVKDVTLGKMEMLEFFIEKGIVDVRADGLIDKHQERKARSYRAWNEWNHRNDQPKPVPPLAGSGLRTPEQIEAKTTLHPQVALDFVADNEFAGRICPVTGNMLVVWSSFDAWWRVPGNRARALNRSDNFKAKLSADAIKKAAAEKDKAQLLAEARELEDERCRRARGDIK